MTKPTIALIYDFDGTLSPGNMQEYSFIEELNMTSAQFWGKIYSIIKRTRCQWNIVLYEIDA